MTFIFKLRRNLVLHHRKLILIAGLLAIVSWQRSFWRESTRLDPAYSIRASWGLHQEWRFAYFYYYLNLFPVAADPPPTQYGRQAASRLFETRPRSLVMDIGWSWRAGERGRILVFMLDALANGGTRDLSVRPVDASLFIAALLLLFVAFWIAGDVLLGSLLVVLLGSNPLQLYEVYGRENLFGWNISIAIILLALHVPLLYGRESMKRVVWLLPIVSGLLLGTVKTIRSEPIVMLAAVVGCYLCYPAPRRKRLLLVAMLGAVFVVCGTAWNRYFDHKFEETKRRVAAVGGNPYPGPVAAAHNFWHPIWCGLGDFDTRFGYEWNDDTAFKYVISKVESTDDDPAVATIRNVIRASGAEPATWTHGFSPAAWDRAHHYPKILSELPGYEAIVRNKVLHDMSHHPFWYAGILAKRIGRVLWQTTPLQIAAGKWRARLAIPGLFLLPILVLLAVRRDARRLQLALFMVPLSLPALLIYSGLGMSLYSCYHLVIAALGLELLLLGLGRAIRARLQQRVV